MISPFYSSSRERARYYPFYRLRLLFTLKTTVSLFYKVEATDALVIQLTPCCQSVLAVMLAKAGVSVGFTYYWI
jgi:hypothetical protein